MNSEKPLHCLLWCWKFKRVMNKYPCLLWDLDSLHSTETLKESGSTWMCSLHCFICKQRSASPGLWVCLVPLGFWVHWYCPNPALLGALKHFAGADWGGNILPPSFWSVNMEILVACTAHLEDPWEQLQHWGLKRVPWAGFEGSAPAQVTCTGGSAGSSWGTRGLCLAKNSSGLLWEKRRQIFNNDPQQVLGCSRHTEELWWLVTSNIKSMWCLGFCGISVGSGIIQIVPVVLPGRRDCRSQHIQPNNLVQNWSLST